MKTLKIKKISEETYEEPKLHIEIDLISGVIKSWLKYVCPYCAGYGCHNGSRACDVQFELKEINKSTLEETVGLEAANLVLESIKKFYK